MIAFSIRLIRCSNHWSCDLATFSFVPVSIVGLCFHIASVIFSFTDFASCDAIILFFVAYARCSKFHTFPFIPILALAGGCRCRRPRRWSGYWYRSGFSFAIIASIITILLIRFRHTVASSSDRRSISLPLLLLCLLIIFFYYCRTIDRILTRNYLLLLDLFSFKFYKNTRLWRRHGGGDSILGLYITSPKSFFSHAYLFLHLKSSWNCAQEYKNKQS